jgi:hypothetical protein
LKLYNDKNKFSPLHALKLGFRWCTNLRT